MAAPRHRNGDGWQENRSPAHQAGHHHQVRSCRCRARPPGRCKAEAANSLAGDDARTCRARVAPSTFMRPRPSCTRRCWVASMAPASTHPPARMLMKPMTRRPTRVAQNVPATVSMGVADILTTVHVGGTGRSRSLKIASSAVGAWPSPWRVRWGRLVACRANRRDEIDGERRPFDAPQQRSWPRCRDPSTFT